mmetsp:Transcript_42334/g.90056  ORF Transcript_42334/g.90056 Transcript_42334/m.90056 type:complete len:335 (-) Transcript_42334:189-1193(-)
MTITADLRPSSPLPWAVPSTPDLTKLYMSASCPELKAESVVSSDDEDYERFEPLIETPEEEAFSMDCPEVDKLDINQPIHEPVTQPAVEPTIRCGSSKLEDQPPICQLCMQQPSLQPSISSVSSSSSSTPPSERRKLQWKFKGLTLWLELEEFDSDLTRAVEDFSSRHSSPHIPKPHTTAIYGMTHLSPDEAKERLHQVPSVLAGGAWPAFDKPTGVTSSIAEYGKPGQVCSIAWSELTLSTSPEHEDSVDALHRLFFGEDWEPEGGRDRPWKPHNSVAYDNPETNALSLLDTVVYASRNPTLLGRERRVEAMSLWITEGKMEEWVCIDRVRFW